MLVEQVTGIKYGELVEIELADGSTRRGGQVLEVSGDTALVQVFEGTSGVNLGTAKIRFLGSGGLGAGRVARPVRASLTA